MSPRKKPDGIVLGSLPRQSAASRGRCALVAGCLFLLWFPQAHAIEYFCQPIDMCSWVPTNADGTPTYHQGDGSAPWVIGGSETVSLAAGDYEVGLSAQGVPIVFVVED